MDLTWNYVGPLLFMAVMGLSLLAYVVLDGYDLGVGLLLPFAHDDDKDIMVSSIGPFWDANETWLVLGVGVLLVAFPLAHGLVLQALYLPVMVMLIGLMARGVAFDFRVKVAAAHKPLWNRVFFIGSGVTSMAQGWMLGSYITGFDTGLWALLFSLGIALVLPAAYAMLGAGWLIMKTSDALQAQSVAWATKVFWPMAVALAAISLATPIVSQTVFAKWFALPELFALLPIPLICIAALWALHHVLASPQVVKAGYGWVVFAATVLIFVMAFFGLAYSIFPYIVIDRLNVWEAASSSQALAILAVGVGVTLPAIIGYTIFMYRVFWGKARELTYGL
jgi:cytochrome bd ubiquinol oxidase subunit II